MFRIIMMFAMFFSTSNIKYSEIEKIECYTNVGENIEFIFSFDCDYVSSHEFLVSFEIFKKDGVFINRYDNAIKILGKKDAKASIDYIYNDDLYVILCVVKDGEKIIDNLRFDLKNNNKCYLDDINRKCEEYYKSTYEGGTFINEYAEIKVLKAPFDSFLNYNFLDLSTILLYSEYDFENSEIYLEIKEKIDEYELVYDNGYRFILDSYKNNDQYGFNLLEEYYTDFENFIYTDNYGDEYIPTKKIYFPFADEYKEYNCNLVIYGNINIVFSFKVSTSDVLFGNCDDSKYCLERVAYD